MKLGEATSNITMPHDNTQVVELDSGSEEEQLDGIPPVTEELQVSYTI